ncbi:MAG: hypothetical protein JW763_07635 [candidate division Zixibacteria bacterium]|nr:hypothetical protein [candidate division Zixibacteria bacterium]
MRLPRLLYALALLVMPLTYSTKFLIGMPGLIWINPTVLLGLILFLLLLPSVEPKVSLLIAISALVSGCLGFIFMLNLSGDQGGLYTVFREPIRTALNFVWFWVVLYFIRRDLNFMLRWLAIGVVVQLLIAIYIWLGALTILPLPGTVAEFVRTYALSQVVWFGDIPVVRFVGTFTESPPFGLYMLSALIIFTLVTRNRKRYSRWIAVGWIAALIGVVGSLATQVLLGLVVFVGICMIFLLRGKQAIAARIVGVVLLVLITPYLLGVIGGKISDAADLRAEVAYGKSGGERLFHTYYGIKLLGENPEYIPFGLGPGRYGRHVAMTGAFPDTVTPQVTPVEWLVEYGVVGAGLLIWWLWLVWKKSRRFGVLGIAAFLGLLLANMFQANWKWEGWFLALAVLYAANADIMATSGGESRDAGNRR